MVKQFFQTKRQALARKMVASHGRSEAEVEAFIEQHGLLSFDPDFVRSNIGRGDYSNPLKIAANASA